MRSKIVLLEIRLTDLSACGINDDTHSSKMSGVFLPFGNYKKSSHKKLLLRLDIHHNRKLLKRNLPLDKFLPD